MTAMFLSEHLDVNPLGHLAVDGVDTRWRRSTAPPSM